MTNDFFDQKGNSGLEAELFATAFDFRCPFLGTKDDRSMIFGFPNPANRCYKQQPPARVDQSRQTDLCLSGKHAVCPIFLQEAPPDDALPEKEAKSLLFLAWLQKLRPRSSSLERLRPKRSSFQRLRPKSISLERLRLQVPSLRKLRPQGLSLPTLRPQGEWLQRLRPALFIIPLLLLVIAALVWWPMPGTTVEDNTSRAAPLQKITTPAEETPELGLQENAPLTESDDTASTPEAAEDIGSTAPVEDTDSAAESEPPPGYRVLSYD